MEKSYSESYAAAGVDITAGYRSVELMKQYVARRATYCFISSTERYPAVISTPAAA